MKTSIIILTTVLSFNFSFADSNKSAKLTDSHSTIYTVKVRRVVNAIDIGNFSTEKDYLKMLQTACKRNKCNSLEAKTIENVGKQITNCQIVHLKSHEIENSDATNICQSKQAMFGCDSLATPLLRRMCYAGNKYSLKTWKKKEKTFKSRIPASAK